MSIGTTIPMEEQPPTYASSAPPDEIPTYTRTPRQSEVTVRSASDLDSCISGEEYIYRSKHLELSLGNKVWGTKAPAYGLGADVQGKISLSGALKKVSRFVVELEGRVTTTLWERGLVVGATTAKILSSTVSVTPPDIADGTRFEQDFSIPFPTYAEGRRSKLPPSTIMYLPGATSEVKYRLKVKVVRLGLHRRNESVKVAVLYLPRTYAKQPIPSFVSQFASPSSTGECLANTEIQVINLQPKHKSSSKPVCDAPVVNLVLPSSHSFAYHEAIPFSIGVFSSSGSAVNTLLLSSTKVQLIKRNFLWNKGRPSVKIETIVGSADSLRTESSSDYTSVLSGKLRLSRSTDSHQSWNVEKCAGKEYFIRVFIYPPASTATYLPSFEYEHPMEVTTDAYDSLEREATSLSGVSSPALSSIAAVRHITELQSGRATYAAIR